LEKSAPFLESLNGERQYFSGRVAPKTPNAAHGARTTHPEPLALRRRAREVRLPQLRLERRAPPDLGKLVGLAGQGGASFVQIHSSAAHSLYVSKNWWRAHLQGPPCVPRPLERHGVGERLLELVALPPPFG
jgi:hypothetical protein